MNYQGLIERGYMNLHQPNLTDLFKQLGLSSEELHMNRFIERHQINSHADLLNAIFWTSDQRDFLREAIQEDSEWAEIVDEFANLLIRKP